MPRKKKKIEMEKIKPTIKDFDAWVKKEAERTGKSEIKIIEEIFKDGFLVIQESGVSLDMSQLYAQLSSKKIDLNEEYRKLRQNFAPISACIDYIRDSILGGGVDFMIDDSENTFQKDVKKEAERLAEEIYQDEYLIGLDNFLRILVDEALTVGSAGAEIIYDKDVDFWDYASISEQRQIIRKKNEKIPYILYDVKKPDWKSLGGIRRLKIINNAYRRLKLYRDPMSWEAKYWSLDENVGKNDILEVGGVKIRKLVGGKKKVSAIFLHPWQVFWLALNRKDYSEIGESMIKPVYSIAKLLKKILDATGEGIYRAGNKKYFIICGTEKRPWSAPHIRNVLQQLKEASKKNWSTIPVPAGFDVKDIGGDVIDARDIIQTLLKVIAHGMRVPAKVLGVEVRDEPTFTYRRLKDNLKMAIRNQLLKRHLWCIYGEKRTKKGGKGEEPTYIPRVRFKTEELLSRRDKLQLFVDMLNVANPLSPEVKLQIEHSICEMMGWDNVLLPTQEELQRQLEEEAKKAEKEKKKQKKLPPQLEKAQGEPEPQTEERQKKRLEGMQKKVKGKRGKAKPLGGTRIPKERKPKK